MQHTDHGVLPAEPEKATLEGRNKILGFWLFLGGEMVLFGSLFATYLALRDQYVSGPAPHEIFKVELVAMATILLLTSSLTSVFAIIGMHRHNFKMMMFWFAVTVVLGFAFLGLEIYEFYHYYHEGHTMTSSAYGSAFYTLVGFHGAHVLFGVTWIATLMASAMKKGLTVVTAPKFYIASLYWHFVDVVWVFIFTVVYLMGIMSGQGGA
ncbi:cytochrome (ubi)quinol oxidase subunit III [Brevibacillus laterosporus]|uniref:cytochrome (ubi)quinol oxidase subunit III n=1 Tax=Brevibacillus laterosporus TaxID=1465 RepID=UPI002652E521|nr:cytochrome (ubi)quinol oxidase subunit III [Brevibacillus laterosporus]MDN9008569.1 cytochrome (ubi)quinol oxidase subunit III [Brevibacillus laterosporus]MDO0939655.1 cytochrome (ubi)quinol oxidase subunit III [Brevibacillus laterosporus]